MSKPIYFTGLRSIRRTEFVVHLIETPGRLTQFKAELNLDRLRLPPDAQIIVEAYDDAYFERIPAGTIAAHTLAAAKTLEKLEPGHRPKFRLKVNRAMAGGAPLLLAAINSVRPLTSDSQDGATSLLELVRRDRTALGHELWRVHIPESGEPEPQLWVNDSIPGLYERFEQNHPELMAMVMPEVFRRVLTELFVDLEELEIDREDEGARGRWLQFGESIATPIDEGEEDVEFSDAAKMKRRRDWVNMVVKLFAQQHRFADLAASDEEGQEGGGNG